MRILVLGGGAQGRVIAGDLARRLAGARVTVADVRDPRLPALPNLAWREADCAEPGAVARLMREHDFAVGALPSRLGFAAMRAAIEAGRDLVDVSFCGEDALTLDAEARAAGVAIVPDAGLAPGISNLGAGEAYARRGPPRELLVMVGGVAQDRGRPYGYVVTWSLEDLNEEYVRPARIVRGGRQVGVPVFSGLERVSVEGVGEMEAFYSDGLRSLMDTLPGVSEMGEKTLRWPGHVEAVKPLVAEGRLVGELRALHPGAARRPRRPGGAHALGRRRRGGHARGPLRPGLRAHGHGPDDRVHHRRDRPPRGQRAEHPARRAAARARGGGPQGLRVHGRGAGRERREAGQEEVVIPDRDQ